MDKTGKIEKTSKAPEVSKVVSAKDLAVTALKKPMSEAAFSTWIRSLLQNWRQGTVAVKGRADVKLSGRKPWKQKGTGRARAGTARSPIWRGGGVTFGPQPRVRKLKVTKNFKKRALNAILFEYINDDKIVSLDWVLPNEKPKTKAAFEILKQIGLHKKKVNLFLAPHDLLTYASFVNIPNVKILFFDQANAYDLVNSEYWVFLNKDLDKFKEMVSRWI